MIFTNKIKTLQTIIEYSFYLLFFLVPLIFTPFNYELFEYNKMMLTYGITAIILACWILKMVCGKRLIFRRTPLDIPLLLFFLLSVISTIFSIDPHVSLFGYYSRFNGGLLSIFSYVILFYSFVTHFPKEKIGKLFFFMFSSAILISLYGVLEHFGIDKNIWVQDVQNRVFSTLGQPNWLAAYLIILLPLALGKVVNRSNLNCYSEVGQTQNSPLRPAFGGTSQGQAKPKIHMHIFVYWSIATLSFTTLLFTKSRSGFIGFSISFILFFFLLFLQFKKEILKIFFVICSLLFVLVFLFGTPFMQYNGWTLPELTKLLSKARPSSTALTQPIGETAMETGITESSDIRRIVWKGALDIAKAYPLFGTGIETFTFAYYRFRPAAHNMTSEWDFLYNKAHNEYLNYAATTGFLGLGSYLLIIGGFAVWSMKKIVSSIKYKVLGIKIDQYAPHLLPTSYLLLTTLFIGWVSILITNFFGFSVVIVQLFFFLIPAIVFVLSDSTTPLFSSYAEEKKMTPFSSKQKITSVFVLCCLLFVLYFISRFWLADMNFAAGYNDSRKQKYVDAYKEIKMAILLNNSEPLYFDELSVSAAQIALALAESKDATESAMFANEAIAATDKAISISPQNVNFWKTRTRVFFGLSTLDETYFPQAVKAIQIARELSPTDPKIAYNLAVLYDQAGKTDEAIAELRKAVQLKPNYKEAYFGLGVFYAKTKQKGKAIEAYTTILNKIDKNDAETQNQLEILEGKKQP